MAAIKLYNLARMTTATTGTGTMTLGSAVSSYLSFADAGVSNGDIVRYAIEDGLNREIGFGTYTSSGTTLSRDTVTNSTNGGSKISLSGNAQVFITPANADFPWNVDSSTGIISASAPIAVSDAIVSNGVNVAQFSKNWSSANPANLMFVSTSYKDAARVVIRRANGTIAVPSEILSGEDIGNVNFRGYHSGGDFSVGTANMRCIALENFTSSAQGSKLAFGASPIGTGGAPIKMEIDAPTTATYTGLTIWDVDNGQLERVTVGAADSGGAGFKVLRIAN